MNLENLLNYEFKDKKLLSLALTHKSYSHESRIKGSESSTSGFEHNEKLEFLGDAVVDLVVSEILMKRFPNDDEGNLSKKRASLVNESILADFANEIGLAQHMILGRGELLTGGDKKPRLLASALEALVGSLFLDGGFEVARSFLQRLLDKNLDKMFSEHDFATDFKTRLQEIVQGEFKVAPVYKLIGEKGPSHDRIFEVEVSIQENMLNQGIENKVIRGLGRSKKSAEQEAAKMALQVWTTKVKEGGQ
jgi:ribonuclease-3